MPIYEFECDDCGTPFESLVIGFSTENVTCPECKSKDIKKKLSSFAFSGNSQGASTFSTSNSCATGST